MFCFASGADHAACHYCPRYRLKQICWCLMQRNITDRREVRYQVAILFHIFLTKYCLCYFTLDSSADNEIGRGCEQLRRGTTNEIMCMSCALLRLVEPPNSPYHQMIPLALLMSSQRHDWGRSVMHTEEFGEANLSRVSNCKRTHAWATNVTVVDSLCHLLSETKTSGSKIHVRNIRLEFVTHL